MIKWSNDSITIYEFCDAPDELKNLFENDGDEDWIAIVPINIHNRHYEYIMFLNSTSFCASGHPHSFDIMNDDKITHKIYIGSHS